MVIIIILTVNDFPAVYYKVCRTLNLMFWRAGKRQKRQQAAAEPGTVYGVALLVIVF